MEMEICWGNIFVPAHDSSIFTLLHQDIYLYYKIYFVLYAFGFLFRQAHSVLHLKKMEQHSI